MVSVILFTVVSGVLALSPVSAQGPIPPAARAAAAEAQNPAPVAPKAIPTFPQRPAESLGTAATVSTTVSMDVLDANRQLARGDVINFRIVEDKDPPIALRINDSGDIEIPYIGTVAAGGKTPRELAFSMKSMLERDYYHNATVIISLDTAGQRSAGLFYLTGAVAGGGPMEIPFNEKFTVSKAIMRAGGFAEFANQRKVLVTRPQPDGTTETIVVNVKEVIEKGRQDLDVEVLPNDIIRVTERLINF
ncbi:MAG: polysaccharide biosynthesis/export family protein [Chthoniobacterales bacterium]|nr:polysaccharide biosynthesis/export family protein [Chthoniobacterales bacterium]